MLSILIPIYNQDVRPLVYNLAKQCNKLNINYQILCFDDCSTQKYKDKNQELASKFNINYTELSENLGRSKIRNWLGKAAYFEYVLFLDGDSKVRSKDFIKKYIEHLPTDGAIYGGRKYVPKKPKNTKKVLHWRYGAKREALSAKKRSKNAYLNFQSNNFLIPEQLFKEQLFDEKMKGYGYEDLLYAFNLQKKGIPIYHIDNPVIHLGLEYNTVFLKKTEHSIDNLVKLYQNKSIPPTRLVQKYTFLKENNLITKFNWLYGKFKTRIDKNLLSTNPNIWFFNLWKLHLFIKKLK
jgi:hypothetical protein